jgi:AraC-like DNA-binding protein
MPIFALRLEGETQDKIVRLAARKGYADPSKFVRSILREVAKAA